jgi:hypothetical protein
MANNIDIKDAAGATVTVATTEAGGVHTPKHAIEGVTPASGRLPVAAEGYDAGAGNYPVAVESMPAYDAVNDRLKIAVQSTLAYDAVNDRLKIAVQSTPGYDAADDMVRVKSMQKKFRDSFTGASLDATKWASTIGTGGAISQSGGQLTIGSGTTASAETSILSNETFTIPFRVQIALTLSQRIANQSFLVEAVSVDPVTLAPNNLHAVAWLFDGTTATQAKYRVQNGGLTPLDSAASTVVTTASGGLYELEPFADEAWFHSATLDATTGRANSYRRHQQIPEPNATYKLRLRWLNGATPPASNTNAVIQFLACQDYAELTAEITAGRGQSAAGQALGVAVTTALPAGTAALGSVTLGAGAAAIGSVSVTNGQAAHDAVIAGNPMRIAARALSAAYATVATGDQADLVSTLQGVLVTRPFQIPELEWSFASPAGGVVNTTDVVLAAAAGAGLRRYITGLQLSNANATATEVVLKDGATVIWRGNLPGNAENVAIQFPDPLKTTANAALNFACITTAAAVYVNAQGYTAA